MINFTYTKGCRNCQCNMGQGIYSVLQGDEAKYIDSTEFQLMLLIDKWLKEGGISCPNCSSKNIEIFDISVNSNKSYTFKKLKQKSTIEGFSVIIIELNKKGNSTQVKRDGHFNIPPSTVKVSFEALYKLINELDSLSLFKEHEDGYFYACMLVDKDKPFDGRLIIEKLRYVGFSKEMLVSILKQIEENF